MMDVPQDPIQVIEKSIVDCGLQSEGVSVEYEETLQGFVITITSKAGVSKEKFDCIHKAAGHELVTFESDTMQSAYREFADEKFRPQILKESRKFLEREGLLENFPVRSNFSSDKLFAEALEQHCAIPPGWFFIESQWGGLTMQPRLLSVTQGDAVNDRALCLLNAVKYADAKGDSFRFGFIGNEQIVDKEE